LCESDVETIALNGPASVIAKNTNAIAISRGSIVHRKIENIIIQYLVIGIAFGGIPVGGNPNKGAAGAGAADIAIPDHIVAIAIGGGRT
jgi:hypothetical protein